MRLIAHCVHPACIDPAVEEVEQRTYRDRIINRLICKPGLVKRFNISRLDRNGMVVHRANKAKQSLFRLGQKRRLEIYQHACHKLGTSQQFRRDRGVGLRSKRTLVQLRRIGCDQFADPWRQWRRLAQHLLCEPLKVYVAPILYENMCRICGYSGPTRFIISIARL